MNKRTRGFILVTLALSLGFWLTAQSPSFPLIQGRVLIGGKIVPVQVDKNGVVQTSGSGGSGCPNPCPVIGPTAVGAIPAVAPVVMAGVDNATGAVRTLLVDTNGNLLPNVNIAKVGGGNVAGGGGAGTLGVGGPAAAGATAGNPFVTGYRDDNANAQADYGFPDQAAVTISAGTDTVMVTGVMSTQTYVGHVSFSLDSAQTVTIRQGTGTTCGTNTLILYGPAPALAGVALDFDSRGGLHTTIAARDLCLHLGGSATVGGGVWYGQH